LQDDFPDAYYNLGNTLKDLGRFEEAEDSYRKALKLAPLSAHIHAGLAYTLLAMGKQELAFQSFSESCNLLRGEKKKQNQDVLTRFRQISKAKIDHDIEQFEYLVSQDFETQKFNELATLYRRVSSEINWPSESEIIVLRENHHRLLKESYNLLLHRIEAPKINGATLGSSLNVKEITNDYFEHSSGLTYFDDFLSPPAIKSLREFLLGSTIWFGIKSNGYLGAYLKEGMCSPLLLQIAEELRKKFPKIFKHHSLTKAWAFKYDSRAKKESSSLGGIAAHADFAAINLNFWITPNEANLNPKSGGLVVYDVEAPLEWDFNTYNSDKNNIQKELKKSKGKTKVIPYKENRAVLFNSNLFHESDTYEFQAGYENRRINVTMLFGNRNAY